MIRQIPVFILLCLLSVCVAAQTEKYSAPVKWENYKVTDRNVSILLPKMPVLIRQGNPCAEEEINQYAAYAENVVYGLSIHYKIRRTFPKSACEQNREFGEASLAARLNQLKTVSGESAVDETKFNQNGLAVTKIKKRFSTYWIFDDLKNKRWFEVWITSRTANDEKDLRFKRFVESLKIGKNPVGIEIENGSPKMLGDEIAPTASAVPEATTTEKVEIEPIQIILRASPPYTEAARQASVQGTVRLRITFLASGGIGDVAAVTALPYGLTEQAIAAARKIVFLPMTKNGVNSSVSKIVEYSFSIY